MAGPLQWSTIDPEQQSLLLAALSSNKQKPAASDAGIDPSVFDASLQSDFDLSSFDETAFQDFTGGGLDLDLPPSTEDLTNGLDDFSPSADGEGGEKRKSFDEDDDDDLENGDPKRRESDDKGSKKPGRKPLTSEPTTKRKAQNRAAQRAFRERKEQHLKNLETKVGDLERASESANHENSVLRAQVDRLQIELKDYRKRISAAGASLNASPPRNELSFLTNLKTASAPRPVDFNFDFPRFGSLPGSQMPRSGSTSTSNPLHSVSSGDIRSNNSSTVTRQNSMSPHANQIDLTGSGASSTDASGQKLNDTLGGIFSPGFTNSTEDNQFGLQKFSSPEPLRKERSELFSNNKRNESSPSVAGSATSPSSSTSHTWPNSSCCTSPESFETWAGNGTGADSQMNENVPKSTEGSTPGLSVTQTSSSDFNNSFDWLATQNGGQFDPVLFGDYRESQAAIMGNSEFSGGFFEDSLTFPDLKDPFNFNMAADTTIPAPIVAPSPAKSATKSGKLDLMEQVRRQREGEDDETSTQDNWPATENQKKSLMTCHKIWNQLQNCPKFKEGDFDIDSLCTELASKAKCTETGVAVPKEDVEKALWRLAGKKTDGNFSSMHFPDQDASQNNN